MSPLPDYKAHQSWLLEGADSGTQRRHEGPAGNWSVPLVLGHDELQGWASSRPRAPGGTGRNGHAFVHLDHRWMENADWVWGGGTGLNWCASLQRTVKGVFTIMLQKKIKSKEEEKIWMKGDYIYTSNTAQNPLSIFSHDSGMAPETAMLSNPLIQTKIFQHLSLYSHSWSPEDETKSKLWMNLAQNLVQSVGPQILYPDIWFRYSWTSLNCNHFDDLFTFYNMIIWSKILFARYFSLWSNTCNIRLSCALC